ncbi:glutathione S-transferase [Rhizobium sp. TRM95111]|uniref:glutathione S-transferase family protein n=1 Tax=Rhizobium alarense TaxID=2846851 RepID=UPI001F24A91A|nr:glutathione S-transferase family protein [Rhizobium alarense]MCF3638651.1 glutathione S-transferase [Rhizobium alarense]
MAETAAPVTLFGARYSVYVRIVLAVLGEKGVACGLVPVDVFAEDGLSADYLSRHPFGRIPAFEHDGFRLHETSAIARYVDEAFPGPSLQPAGLRERARMNQIVAMLDNYAYRPMVWDVYVERVLRAAEGAAADEARIAAGLSQARVFLDALAALSGGSRRLAGPDLSLADLHAAPIFDYFTQAPDGAAMLGEFPALGEWWERLRTRPSVAAALA